MGRPFVIVTLLVGGLVAAWGAIVVLEALARSETTSVRPLEIGRGGLKLATGSGDVAVVAGSGPPRLEVDATSSLFGTTRVRVEQGPGDVVSIETDCPVLSLGSCGASLRAIVPAGTPVEVGTGSGEVVVRGVRRGVTAETGSGDVRLQDVTGDRVVADTGSGEVTAFGVRARSVSAETGSGDVRITTLRPPDDLSVDTGSGEVTLFVPDVGYDIGTDTGSGDQRVMVRPDPGSPRRLRVQTGSGDVVVLPAGGP